jgi:hypothetical protein
LAGLPISPLWGYFSDQIRAVHLKARYFHEVVIGGIFTEDEFTRKGSCFKIQCREGDFTIMQNTGH